MDDAVRAAPGGDRRPGTAGRARSRWEEHAWPDAPRCREPARDRRRDGDHAAGRRRGGRVRRLRGAGRARPAWRRGDAGALGGRSIARRIAARRRSACRGGRRLRRRRGRVRLPADRHDVGARSAGRRAGRRAAVRVRPRALGRCDDARRRRSARSRGRARGCGRRDGVRLGGRRLGAASDARSADTRRRQSVRTERRGVRVGRYRAGNPERGRPLRLHPRRRNLVGRNGVARPRRAPGGGLGRWDRRAVGARRERHHPHRRHVDLAGHRSQRMGIPGRRGRDHGRWLEGGDHDGVRAARGPVRSGERTRADTDVVALDRRARGADRSVGSVGGDRGRQLDPRDRSTARREPPPTRHGACVRALERRMGLGTAVVVTLAVARGSVR